MKLIRKIDELTAARGSLKNSAVSIGNFDGVHHGHQKLISRLTALATKHGGPSVVFTFDPHPVRLLRPEKAPPPLTWTKRKAALLSALGVDFMVAYPTDHDLLQLTPDEFFQQIVLEKLGTAALVEGPNFYFGKNRAGDVNALQALCDANKVTLEVVQPTEDDGELISSSRVRAAIAAGDIDGARRMLTSPYRVRGMVTHGAARGSKIGFPTANLSAIDTLVPGHGVYAGIAHVSGESFQAAINIGTNPTFGEDECKVEAHLLDFDRNIYGQAVEVDFLTRLRDIQPFPNVEALTTQLRHDIESTRSAN